jgi:hypothetical protein
MEIIANIGDNYYLSALPINIPAGIDSRFA